MILKIFTIASFLVICNIAAGQVETDINKTDNQGRKQGHWIKRYPDKNVQYEGFFKDNHPVGEFNRYFENKKLMSKLIYSDDGTEANATFYHPNGYIASKGKYINQKKEGKWQFYSSIDKGYLVSEEYYSGNIRNGTSIKFYPDSTVAERVSYINDIKEGPWIQYYPNGAICLKSNYANGKVNGKYEVWFENGQIEFSGQYKDDARDGLWYIYNKDGSLKYKLEYKGGVTDNIQMDIDESNYLDSLERNKGKIADPEISGIIR